MIRTDIYDIFTVSYEKPDVEFSQKYVDTRHIWLFIVLITLSCSWIRTMERCRREWSRQCLKRLLQIANAHITHPRAIYASAR